MSPWGWQPKQTLGIWRHGAAWARPMVAAVPWVTLVLLLLMLNMLGGRMSVSRGVLFELPDAGLSDGDLSGPVALVMPIRHEIMVFFDDARFVLGDEASARTLGDVLSERMSAVNSQGKLVVLADRRVSGGDLMRLAAIARRSGVKKVLFAEKREVASE